MNMRLVLASKELSVITAGLILAMMSGCNVQDQPSQTSNSSHLTKPSAEVSSEKETPIAEKSVNALIADAEIGFFAKYLMSATSGDSTERVLEVFKKEMGGLWVGGTAALYEKKLRFRPNAMNQAVHAGDYSLEIPLHEISEIKVRSGLLTNIIDIVTAKGVLSIRCFGAEDFAKMIRDKK